MTTWSEYVVCACHIPCAPGFTMNMLMLNNVDMISVKQDDRLSSGLVHVPPLTGTARTSVGRTMLAQSDWLEQLLYFAITLL